MHFNLTCTCMVPCILWSYNDVQENHSTKINCIDKKVHKCPGTELVLDFEGQNSNHRVLGVHTPKNILHSLKKFPNSLRELSKTKNNGFELNKTKNLLRASTPYPHQQLCPQTPAAVSSAALYAPGPSPTAILNFRSPAPEQNLKIRLRQQCPHCL